MNKSCHSELASAGGAEARNLTQMEWNLRSPAPERGAGAQGDSLCLILEMKEPRQVASALVIYDSSGFGAAATCGVPAVCTVRFSRRRAALPRRPRK